MKQLVLALGFGLVFAAALAPRVGEARGVIESACLSSDRPTASRVVCGCLQAVADAVLSPGEQRRGAKFFSDPDLSQATKISNRRADVLFWEKWEEFAEGAVQYCQ